MRYCPEILKGLQSWQIPSGFAISGKLVASHEEIVRAIIEHGHEIINHTMTHPSPFDKIHGSRLRFEIAAYQGLMEQEFGYRPNAFRAPHLLKKSHPELFAELSRLGMIDTSLVGTVPISIDGTIEVPITPHPFARNVAFDSYHHFRLLPFAASEEGFLRTWKTILEKYNFANLYLDPIDLMGRENLLERIVTLTHRQSFEFLSLSKIGTLCKSDWSKFDS